MVRLYAVLIVCGTLCTCNGSDANVPQSTAAGKGAVVKLGNLSSNAPASWKEGPPAFEMRKYQFVLPKAAGDAEDAELVVFYFDGQGGGVADNIARWKGFFSAPEGKTIDDVSKVDKFKVGNVNVTYLDVTGTLLSKTPPFDPKAKTVKKTDYRRFGVIFESNPGPYFITVTGPARTLEQHKKEFDDWLKNFK